VSYRFVPDTAVCYRRTKVNLKQSRVRNKDSDNKCGEGKVKSK